MLAASSKMNPYRQPASEPTRWTVKSVVQRDSFNRRISSSFGGSMIGTKVLVDTKTRGYISSMVEMLA